MSLLRRQMKTGNLFAPLCADKCQPAINGTQANERINLVMPRQITEAKNFQAQKKVSLMTH